VRLDLFLKASRLCPRRSSAQVLCDARLVSLNDRPVKSSHQVKVGDEITIQRRDRETKIKVLSIPATRQVSKKEAIGLYEVISDVELDRDQIDLAG
jgi:ribosomal 50S subunit-recycling heat shock protein